MKQIKLFSCATAENLERAINQFIVEQQNLSHEIVDICYNHFVLRESHRADWTAMVIYKTGEKVAE